MFAFVFAPVGAVLGHLALGQIARTGERGRDRALIGVTLSYALIAVAVVGLTLSLIMASGPRDTSSVTATSPDGVVSPTQPTQPRAPGTRRPLPAAQPVLLSLEEVRSLLDMPGLSETQSGSGGGSGDAEGDADASPAECVGAVAPGIDTVYDRSGAVGFQRSSFSDTSSATMVEQLAAEFPTAAAARDFIAENRAQWRECAGKTFTVTSSGGTLTWEIGTPGGTADRVTLDNTIATGPGVPQGRIMAVRGKTVIEVSLVSPLVADEAGSLADRILARIPS
ncbi:sensor domain-containing protein [[Mycobacterium] wendilense]|uniref:sensor domain-containing protein n=1 Tax=[Mycobacterium] wendilense TaxID=3064284 RepID=UPI0037C6276A